MTKQQRAERKDLYGRLKTVRRNMATALGNIHRAKGRLEKQHRKALKAMERDLAKQKKGYDRDLRIERQAAEKEELAILNRIAAVEGRLAS